MSELELTLAARCVVLEFRLSQVTEPEPVSIGGAYLRFLGHEECHPNPTLENQGEIINRAMQTLGLTA